MFAKKMLALMVPALALGLWGCDVEQTEEGELRLPEYEQTQEGDVDVDLPAYEQAREGAIDLPEYDVQTPEVDVRQEPTTIRVPDVDVDMEERPVNVPDVDVRTPDGGDAEEPAPMD